ncbi:lysophospholipid acyltransferase family protein [Acidithiobacillus sp. IBUN Pt1247-S3]|uniref:lysophospholipid acyltransferase family protein n=1 Tax=Acidithiobacillus sp. IBUN Pt1247-S3 TaxID=3166642 RepID=UPI0034E5BB0A
MANARLDSWLALGISKLLWLLAHSPRSTRVWVGNRLGDLARLAVPRGRRVARTNLALAFPELGAKQRQALLYRHFRQLGQAFIELGPLWFWPLPKSLALIRSVQGAEAVDAALAKGNGVVLFTAHLGAWEAAVQYIGQRWPVTVLYMPTRNAAINAQMVAGRGRSGAHLVAKDGGIRGLLQALQKGEVVGVLPDQNVDPREGVFAPFFGRPACTTPLLARLAQRRGSPVFGLFAYRLSAGEGFEIEIVPLPDGFPSGDDEADAAAMNAALEAAIRRAPEQYWWVHRRYKDPAPGWDYPY